ncbi:hypothetical protein EKO27_g7683 [Xylaria grammica]|uniref:Uncharacterized protein n=1 Tax=Xylaria grammica TaxID=363999 RepID=A0A439CZK8_9PEZI|nr:hypothetical protein EKO27_g7683 [Xylaria grammica]
MRWSLVNIAGIALIGLTSVLSGTNGAPVDLISADANVATKSLKFGLPFTPILNSRAGIISGGRGGLGGGIRGGDGEGGDEVGNGEGEETGSSGSGGSAEGTGSGGPNPGGFGNLDKPRSGKTYPPKEVPNPWDDVHKYRAETSFLDDHRVYGTIYKVFSGDGKNMVDQIGINTEDNSINVLNANNGDDDPPAGRKMYLSDIEMALFKLAGKNPQDLSFVRFDTVGEDTTRPAMEQALAALGKDPRGSATVTSTDTGKEGEVFDSLLATTFGANVDRLNQEFGTGKGIVSFFIDLGDPKELIVTLG